MKYRIVQLADGRYQAQFRCLFFWWFNSCYAPSRNLDEQIWFVQPTPKRSAIKSVVWP